MMPDEVIDHDARGGVRGLRQLMESHERSDVERFDLVRADIKEVKETQEGIFTKMDSIVLTLNAKMDTVKDLIGSRPSWTVMMIISSLVGLVGFLTARVFPA